MQGRIDERNQLSSHRVNVSSPDVPHALTWRQRYDMSVVRADCTRIALHNPQCQTRKFRKEVRNGKNRRLGSKDISSRLSRPRFVASVERDALKRCGSPRDWRPPEFDGRATDR